VSTWEERMAERAARRREIARAKEEQERQWEHSGHHQHLDLASVYCSCGEFFGVTTVSVPVLETPEEKRAWDARACAICGQPGVIGLGGLEPHWKDDQHGYHGVRRRAA
jgi:hypothetical protein